MKKTYIQPVVREIHLYAEDLIATSFVDSQEKVDANVNKDQSGSIWEDSSGSIWGN